MAICSQDKLEASYASGIKHRDKMQEFYDETAYHFLPMFEDANKERTPLLNSSLALLQREVSQSIVVNARGTKAYEIELKLSDTEEPMSVADKTLLYEWAQAFNESLSQTNLHTALVDHWNQCVVRGDSLLIWSSRSLDGLGFQL